MTVAVGWLRDLEHVARHDPARVLAEVEAKRRILSNWQEANREAPKTRWQGWHPDEALCQARRLAYESVIRLLALPYADRPGYLEAWRP